MTVARRASAAEINAFVDGELAPAEAAEIAEMLAAAPLDLAMARELRELNEALRARYADALAAPASPAVETRLARFVRGRQSFGRLVRPVAAAAAIALIAAASGYWVRGLLSEPGGPEAQFVAMALGAHRVYVSEVRHPVEVKAGEAHLVRWLAKRVGADIRAPVLTAKGWTLMGGRLLADPDGLPVAQFMYDDPSGRRLTLYMRKETGLHNTAFRFLERDGFGAFYWIDHPLTYALTGRLSRAELASLADAVYAQLDVPEEGKAR